MDDLYQKLKKISGSHTHTDWGFLYGSFHYDNFNYSGVRNTLDRFEQYSIPDDLTDNLVLDLGSNTGAMSFEFARRGAKVIGLEYRQDRVDVCNELAEYLKVDASFYQADFNVEIPDLGQFDIVSCMSVDAYIDDRPAFYAYVKRSMENLCYFESNYPESTSKDLQKEVKPIRDAFEPDYWVEYIGTSITLSRRLFAIKKRAISLIDGLWTRRVSTQQKYAYEKIKDVSGIVEAKFHDSLHNVRSYCTRKCWMVSKPAGETLNSVADSLTNHEKQCLKKQLITFLVELNKKGFAHRDLHSNNVLVDEEGKLTVIDLEFVMENKAPLHRAYDIIGEGCPKAPPQMKPATIFREYDEDLNVKQLAGILDIEKTDFLLHL